MNNKVLFLSFTVSLGGFLFGFDAGIISGVMNFVGPEFELNEVQTGWVVSSPSFAAMIAMLIAGKLSDNIGRKKILIGVAFLYSLSAIILPRCSAYAPTASASARVDAPFCSAASTNGRASIRAENDLPGASLVR